MKQETTLRKKLAGYSALAAGIIAIAGKQSTSQVVYTDVDPNFKSDYDHAYDYDLDLNNDGIVDFEIFGGWNYIGYYGGYTNVYVSVMPYHQNEVVGFQHGSYFYASRLNESAAIDLNNNWMAIHDYIYLKKPGVWDQWGGNIENKYLGLKLKKDNHTYYGWARLDVSHGWNLLFKLKDYAYNATPDQTISAGSTLSSCADVFEPNDSKLQAAPIQNNVLFQGMIDDAMDQDWFRIKILAQQQNARIRLFNLPENYNVYLYDSAHVKIGWSENQGTKQDTVIANALPPGNYFIKIKGQAGHHDPVICYTLNVETSATPWKIDNGSAPFDNQQTVFELYPNPASNQILLSCNDEKISDATINIFNLMGQIVAEQKQVFISENSTVPIEVNLLPQGEYLLHIKFSDGTEIKKFVIEK